MKNREEMVMVEFNGEEFLGYLRISQHGKSLEFFVNDLQNSDSLLDESLKTFHCKLVNGITISCFDCTLINSINSQLVTYSIGIYVDGYFRQKSDLSFSKVDAIFPKFDAWFIGKGDDIRIKSSPFKYKDHEITLETIEGTSNKRNIHSETKETFLTLRLETESAIDLELINEIYFRFSVVASLLSESYITYSHYRIDTNDGFWVNIYQRNQQEINQFKIHKTNYRPNSILTTEDFENIFTKTIHSNLFEIWMNYVSTLRSKQLLDDKYLTYARCLEMLAKEKTDTKIYSKSELRSKRTIYKELIEDTNLTEEFKENLVDAFNFSNTKNFRQVLEELLTSVNETGFKILLQKVTLEQVVTNIVRLRNHLTHGLPYEKIKTNSLVFYTLLTQRLIVYLLLREQGVNIKIDVTDLVNRFDLNVILEVKV